MADYSKKGMTRCFVINMADSTDRWTRVHEQFTSQGIEVERFNAHTPADLALFPNVRSLETLLSSDWAPGEVGCTLSHLALWQRLLDSCLSQIAIFEDDIILGAGIAQALSINLPDYPTVLKLETTFQRTCISRSGKGLTGGARVRELLAQHRGAGAYVLNRSAAATLLDMFSNHAERVDVVGFTPRLLQGRVKVQQVYPAVAMQGIFIHPELRPQHFASSLEHDRYAASLKRVKPFSIRVVSAAVRALDSIRLRVNGKITRVPFAIDQDRLIHKPKDREESSKIFGANIF